MFVDNTYFVKSRKIAILNRILVEGKISIFSQNHHNFQTSCNYFLNFAHSSTKFTIISSLSIDRVTECIMILLDTKEVIMLQRNAAVVCGTVEVFGAVAVFAAVVVFGAVVVCSAPFSLVKKVLLNFLQVTRVIICALNVQNTFQGMEMITPVTKGKFSSKEIIRKMCTIKS